ncbi:MAG: hypothetical protein HZB55_01815 [Deltaproteobacteria bacterium]|nr:hypothetical protein [Deltaproteobacteria bacterium]
MIKRSLSVVLTSAVLALFAGIAGAMAPAWMPNFPMRMGAAGTLLMWMPVPGATEYKVLRKVGDGKWETVTTLAPNTYQDPAAPQDNDVSYKVVAIVAGKDGEESPVAVLKGLKPIDPPGNVVGRLGDKQLDLRWDVVGGASFYNLYKSASKEGPFQLVSSLQDTKYADTKIEDGKTYYYQVTSVSSSNQESKKPEAFSFKVEFPKVVVVKKFDPVRRKLKFIKKSHGEDFAEFYNPTDLSLSEGRIFVTDAKTVQVLDLQGEFLSRFSIVQEKVASQQWPSPVRVCVGPQGTLFMTFAQSPFIREISSEGRALLREIKVPAIPGSKLPCEPASVEVGPDGRLWVVDSQYGQVVVLPAGNNAPSNDEVVRLGWARGSDTPFTDKDFVMAGPVLIRYWKDKGLMCVADASRGEIVLINANTLKVEGKIGGFGAGLQQFSSIGDLVVFDPDSILVLDVLGKSVRRLALNGDYLDSFVDDDEKLNLQKPGSISRVLWDPKGRNLYVLSSFENQLYIYHVEG